MAHSIRLKKSILFFNYIFIKILRVILLAYIYIYKAKLMELSVKCMCMGAEIDNGKLRVERNI